MSVSKVVFGSVLLCAFMYWLVTKINEDENENQEEILKSCFGEPLHTDEFTLFQAKKWLGARKSLLDSGSKAIITKVNTDTMAEYCKEFKINVTIDNYLVVAVMDVHNHEIEDSLLVKYNSLEEKLEKLLEKGNGTLVVGG